MLNAALNTISIFSALVTIIATYEGTEAASNKGNLFLMASFSILVFIASLISKNEVKNKYQLKIKIEPHVINNGSGNKTATVKGDNNQTTIS